MKLSIKHRWQAFSVHLAISCLIFIAIYAMTRLVWFPDALFDVSDTWQGIRIVMFVDLVLGPLLTLIVFDRVRKSLKVIARDLTVIGIIQFAGLAAGVYVVHGQKPVLLNVVFDTVYVYTAADLADPAAQQRLSALDPDSPGWVYMDLPEGRRNANKVLATHRIVNGPFGAGLEHGLWKEIPMKEPERKHMLRFSNEVRSLPDCNGVTLEVMSQHSTGRACFDFDRKAVSQFTPL